LKVNAARLKLTTARVYAAEVKYALIASPSIYNSYIKQFWTSAKVKTVNDEVRFQVLVDGKRVNIKESIIRRTLRLDDAKGTSCLTNIEIFEGLAKIGAKTTSWNEFSSTTASAIICLATNQELNFSRFIILSLVKNIEAGVPFFMFPRFIQLIINHQLGDMAHHKEIFNTPSLIKKVFVNIKMVGTGFSREVTPLFDNMLVQAPEEVDLDHQEKVLSMMDVNEEEPADVEEVLEVVKATKLTIEVVTTAGATKEVARQLEAELNADINWNAVIEQVKRNERLNDAAMKYQTLKRKLLTQAQSRRNMIVYLKNIVGFKMDYFKGKTHDEIRPLFEKHYNFNQTFLDEVNEGVKVSETEVRQEKDVEVESSKREGKSLEQEIAKKQKIEEETEELKKHLQIVTDDDDDDVYTDATPMASKIPIVDYKIHTERNRPYFKIIRVDGNHMLFISFSTMLKNFDREDLKKTVE
nr:hypothetical protein [Tanacetum cinerariifolium]